MPERPTSRPNVSLAIVSSLPVSGKLRTIGMSGLKLLHLWHFRRR